MAYHFGLDKPQKLSSLITELLKYSTYNDNN